MTSYLRFQPYVGRHYGKPQSIFTRPTLILGGSAYCDGPATTAEEDAEAINDLVNWYSDGAPGRWKGTYTRFINALYGKETDMEEREAYFSSIIFNNYLQEYAGARPSDAPKSNYRKKMHYDAFIETLNKYRPEAVISWGNLVWDALPDDWGFGPAQKGAPIKVCGQSFASYQTYPYNGRKILLVGVRHPSTSFSRDFHHELFKKLGLLRMP